MCPVARGGAPAKPPKSRHDYIVSPLREIASGQSSDMVVAPSETNLVDRPDARVPRTAQPNHRITNPNKWTSTPKLPRCDIEAYQALTSIRIDI